MLGYAIHLPTHIVDGGGGVVQRKRERERMKTTIPTHISALVLIHGQGLPPAEIFSYHISTVLADNKDNCFIYFVKLK